MKGIILKILRLYGKYGNFLFPKACRFEPSCSRYAQEAIKAKGLVVGGLMTVVRLLRCHPLHPGGWDPVS